MGLTYDALLRDTAVALTAAGIDNVRFEARLLLSHATGLSTETLISRGRDAAPPSVEEKLRALTARRVRREPMAYILGEREFWGLPFKVSPAVLVPRPDSETVIEVALAAVGRSRARLAHPRSRPGLGLPSAHACSRSCPTRAASASMCRTTHSRWPRPMPKRSGSRTAHGCCTATGASATGPHRSAARSIWWCPIRPISRRGSIEGLMPEVARYEPRLALDGGPDGLVPYRLIAAASPRLVDTGGHVLVEMGEGQAIEIAHLFEDCRPSSRSPGQGSGGHRSCATSDTLNGWQSPSIETTFLSGPWGAVARVTGIHPSQIEL